MGNFGNTAKSSYYRCFDAVIRDLTELREMHGEYMEQMRNLSNLRIHGVCGELPTNEKWDIVTL